MPKLPLAIISMFKNEAWILREWIEHHLSVGVSHFYMIDNGSTDNSRKVLDPYLRRGVVTLIYDAAHVPGDKGTMALPSYDHARHRYVHKNTPSVRTQAWMYNKHYLLVVREHYDWVAVMDCDEYLYSTQQTLPDVLSGVQEEVSSIWVPWTRFGSSGLRLQPKSIRAGFTQRGSTLSHKRQVPGHSVHGGGKSITRTRDLIQLGNHRSVCTTSRTLVPDGTIVADDKELYRWFARHEFRPSTDLIVCNHYAVMSQEYFSQVKAKRPGPSGRPNDPRSLRQYWHLGNRNDVHDSTILQAVTIDSSTATATTAAAQVT